ncbi:hypothetical protein Tco_1427501 [Tanacetum coccineum]
MAVSPSLLLACIAFCKAEQKCLRSIKLGVSLSDSCGRLVVGGGVLSSWAPSGTVYALSLYWLDPSMVVGAIHHVGGGLNNLIPSVTRWGRTGCLARYQPLNSPDLRIGLVVSGDGMGNGEVQHGTDSLPCHTETLSGQRGHPDMEVGLGDGFADSSVSYAFVLPPPLFHPPRPRRLSLDHLSIYQSSSVHITGGLIHLHSPPSEGKLAGSFSEVVSSGSESGSGTYGISMGGVGARVARVRGAGCSGPA